MRVLGAGAAIAAAVQVLVLSWPSDQGAMVSAAVFVAFWQLWAVRRYLNQHVDMILLMVGYGGLAMLPFAPVCHGSLSSFGIMNAAMLAAGVPAVWIGARCVRQSTNPVRLVVLDSAAMVAGMALPHFGVPGHNLALHHSAMLLGMLTGMGAVRFVEKWCLSPYFLRNETSHTRS